MGLTLAKFKCVWKVAVEVERLKKVSGGWGPILDSFSFFLFFQNKRRNAIRKEIFSGTKVPEGRDNMVDKDSI